MQDEPGVFTGPLLPHILFVLIPVWKIKSLVHGHLSSVMPVTLSLQLGFISIRWVGCGGKCADYVSSHLKCHGVQWWEEGLIWEEGGREKKARELLHMWGW